MGLCAVCYWYKEDLKEYGVTRKLEIDERTSMIKIEYILLGQSQWKKL